MAVPKKKRYKQIVRSRRSLQKVELLKRQILPKSYFSNFNNRKSLVSIPVIEQYRFNRDKGYKKFIRILDPKTFNCVKTCCVCHITGKRDVGLSCVTTFYPFISQQWVNFEAPWRRSYWHPKAILSKWYWVNHFWYWPEKKSYRRAYAPQWSMAKYGYTPFEKMCWHRYYDFLFQEAVLWGMYERDRVWRDTWWRRSYDLYAIWDFVLKRLGYLWLDILYFYNVFVYFWIILIDEIIIDQYILTEAREKKIFEFFKKYI